MENCLVTTLRGKLIDQNYGGLNELVLHRKPKTQTEDDYLDCLFKSDGCSIKVIGGANMLSLSADLSNPTNEVTFSLNVRKAVYLADGDYYISIYNKNELELFLTNGNLEFNLEEIAYLNKCLSFRLDPTNYYIYGNIEVLKYLKRYEGVTENWYSVDSITISFFQNANSNIYGEILNIAEGLFDRLGGNTLNGFTLRLIVPQNCTINDIGIPGNRLCTIIYTSTGFSVSVATVWDSAKTFTKQSNGIWVHN